MKKIFDNMLGNLSKAHTFLFVLISLVASSKGNSQPTGALPGVFSINETQQVCFSKGNLQYQASSNTWRFADQQWDCIGSSNSSISSSYNGWIDLFGWGTSGYNHGAVCYQPWSTSTTDADYYAYGEETYNLYDGNGQADWGYNAISNGGNQTGVWRTLTSDEWNYVLTGRATTSGWRFVKATVNGVKGLIILPDSWNPDVYTLNRKNANYVSFDANVISASDWTNVLEAHGAVFLPVANYRSGTTYWTHTYGYYRTANPGNCLFFFDGSSYGIGSSGVVVSGVNRYFGCSVRLVRAASQVYTISAGVTPSTGGKVTGTGDYMAGTLCTLQATPNGHYTFVRWTKNGSTVSTDPTYNFTVSSSGNYVAEFAAPTGGTGQLDGVFSVSQNDQVSFSKGNLQYQASTHTWRFAMNQYECMGVDNQNVSSSYSGWIDLFGWGTSGYNHGATCYQPWSTSTNDGDYYAYGQSSYNLYDQSGKADWGYNAISNGGNSANSGWRTLTYQEWDYLFGERTTSSGIRFAKATVNGVSGVILFPDDWNATLYDLEDINNGSADYINNNITDNDWTNVFEPAGAVFMPADGSMSSGSIVNETYSDYDYGIYWSSSKYNTDRAYGVRFSGARANSGAFFLNEGSLSATTIINRSYALSVRLVRAANGTTPTSYNINVSANPANGGTLSGGGTYTQGSNCTVTATANSGYTFTNWTENGNPVSTSASYTFTVVEDRTLVANFSYNGGNSGITGALDGVFSVSENSHVNFSQGNLQYQASTNTWRFAPNQYDCVGDANQSISQTNSGWIDLFGWGTSGYDHGAVCYQPWSTSTNNSDYYPYGSNISNLYNQTGQADWGYNAIANGGNQENIGWRTLTKDEWDYLFNSRNTANGIRFAKAQVNGVNGVILLPDDWNANYYVLNNTNNESADFASNTISASQWNTLDQHGAVFLAAAGYRNGASVENVSYLGAYWSSSCYSSSSVYTVFFYASNLSTSEKNSRRFGQSVRLVRVAQNYSYMINGISNSSEGGEVSGGGTYAGGTVCTLTATANEGYTFVNWTENGNTVSINASYTFTVVGDRTLVANFSNNGGNSSTGVLKSVFSVSENSLVNFSQGNLQYQASTDTWRFATNQYDYVGEANQSISQTYSGWIDLFGWGTSGYNHGAVCYQPWSTSTNESDYYVYGQYTFNLYDQTGQAEWGYNAISNGGNQENSGWRTLTRDEWGYLLNNRNTANGIRYAKAQVNGVNGVIILPDDWNADYYVLNSPNNKSASFNSNIISASQWNTFDQHGAVFLPAAGYRDGTSVNTAGSKGNYWSASYSGYYAGTIYFIDGNLNTSTYSRNCGHSVRLVRSAQNYSCMINATPNPVEGGVVSGGGPYPEGAECTLTATPNAGYTFVNWTKNGEVVSTDNPLVFTVTEAAEYVANFELSVVTQTINLVEGWNYVSTYIDMSVVDGLAMLQESLGDHGLTIATFDDAAEYLGDGLWIGLEGYQMTNAEMVFVEVDADCTITLQGPVVDPSTVTITIGPEWTLFGFPVTTEMNIGDALGTFEPEFGDGIGSIDGLAEYLGEWDGDFTTLKPGQGYFYWNESGEMKTFVFQTGAKAKARIANPVVKKPKTDTDKTKND